MLMSLKLKLHRLPDKLSSLADRHDRVDPRKRVFPKANCRELSNRWSSHSAADTRYRIECRARPFPLSPIDGDNRLPYIRYRLQSGAN